MINESTFLFIFFLSFYLFNDYDFSSYYNIIIYYFNHIINKKFTKKENLNDENIKIKENDNKNYEDNYIKKYIEKYKNLETIQLNEDRLKELKCLYIIENTPLGNVLMYYNVDDETFSYYSDHTIPYRYLEVCSRKYVNTYNCKSIFIDLEEEIKNKKNEMKDKTENSVENIDDNSKKNVFAKFKSYNKNDISNKKNIILDKDRKTNNTHIDMSNYTIKTTNNKNGNNNGDNINDNESIVLKDKANKYNHLGKFANFDFLKKKEYKKVSNNNFSYRDFKNNVIKKCY